MASAYRKIFEEESLFSIEEHNIINSILVYAHDKEPDKKVAEYLNTIVDLFVQLRRHFSTIRFENDGRIKNVQKFITESLPITNTFYSTFYDLTVRLNDILDKRPLVLRTKEINYNLFDICICFTNAIRIIKEGKDKGDEIEDICFSDTELFDADNNLLPDITDFATYAQSYRIFLNEFRYRFDQNHDIKYNYIDFKDFLHYFAEFNEFRKYIINKQREVTNKILEIARLDNRTLPEYKGDSEDE